MWGPSYPAFVPPNVVHNRRPRARRRMSVSMCAPNRDCDIRQTSRLSLDELKRRGILVHRPRRPDYETHGDEPRGYVEPREVYIVAVSHQSNASVQHVDTVIEAISPNAVVVELCRSRAGLMYVPPTENKIGNVSDGDHDERRGSVPPHKKWNSFGLFGSSAENGFSESLARTLSRGGGVALVMRAMLASAATRSLRSEETGVSQAQPTTKGDIVREQEQAPGKEFRAARYAAERVGATVVLGDRPIECTLRRAWSALSWSERIVLFFFLARSAVFGMPTLNSVKDEKLKSVIEDGEDLDNDVVDKYLQQFSTQFPKLMRPLCYERDMYLAWSLKRSEAVKGTQTVVGIVGIAHVQGILACMDEDDGYRRRNERPPLRFRDLVG